MTSPIMLVKLICHISLLQIHWTSLAGRGRGGTLVLHLQVFIVMLCGLSFSFLWPLTPAAGHSSSSSHSCSLRGHRSCSPADCSRLPSSLDRLALWLLPRRDRLASPARLSQPASPAQLGHPASPFWSARLASPDHSAQPALPDHSVRPTSPAWLDWLA